MNQDTPKLDYLAPNIAELAKLRVGSGADLNIIKPAKDQMTRVVARRLLPACVVVPALLWWVLIFGVHRNWYPLETGFVLFVFSEAVIFGLIVCLNLRKLSRLSAERAHTEAQLKLAKEAAETANRFKSAFFANISHEIRTPLTAINGFAELLLNPERTNEQRMADARVIRRNGEHLLTLINDILDLSKIEAGKMSVDPILCSPAQIVGEVCAMLRQRADEKDLDLAVNFEGPIPKMIRTDPTRLRQILINLIANAVKFTKEGGVSLTVSVKPSFKAANPVLEVNITDSGIGIPAEQLATLFQPFVQGDASISRQYGGSGLGLAISRHFAGALGGDIAVTSEIGKGSTFTVTIGTGSLMETEVLPNPQTLMESHDNFTGPRVRIAGTVLLAEDGIDNQALITAKLRETGLKLEIAPNGQVAFEKSMEAFDRDAPFDLILMDVQMPVMDGFTATHQLRTKGYRGPIIALTANAMERDREKCLNAGCNDFVTKPIQMEKLFKAIGRYLKVVPIAPKSGLFSQDAKALAADRAVLAKKFYQELPAEIDQINEAIRRQDRAQVKEIAQLLLGKAVTAGLNDIAAPAAKLFQAAENEKSWLVLQQAVSEFSNDTLQEPPSQAA